MKESIVTAILAICSGVLLVVAVAGMFLRDRTAPVISLEGKNSLTYTEGDDYDVLLENMTAKDDKDGDVTMSLRVSNIYVTSKDRAMVVYVAKDEANNIGKLKREVRYQEKEQTETGQSDRNVLPETLENTADETQTEEEQTGPKIIMLQNEATLKVGETLNIYRYIQRAVDGNGNDISRNMHMEGTYDMTKAGVYQLQLYVVDSAGVRSETETFTLTVEE